jgi:riboflavin synthase
MFTGIISAVGVVAALHDRGNARRLAIAAPPQRLAGVRPGDSIAVDGVCLTVVEHGAASLSVDVIATTLGRTTIGEFVPGRRVNLEQALALGDRLGGHLVQGHVDGVGRVLSVEHAGEHVLVTVTLPEPVRAVTVLHGSIAIDGVSLTVHALPAPDSAQVALIPYTLRETNLGRLEPGSRVNLEGDMIGRFVVHYLERVRT